MFPPGTRLSDADIALIMMVQGAQDARAMELYNNIVNRAHDNGIENLRRIPAPGANRFDVYIDDD